MNLLSPQLTLVLGIILSFTLNNTESIQSRAKKWSTTLLQVSVIFLGANLNFHEVIRVGAKGFGVTALSLILIFILGFFLMKLFKIEEKLGVLLTMGTAICGGSAIGALAPVIAADSMTIAISMGVVFLLNTIAVFTFPLIGHLLDLSQRDFGLWSALAIHDTSSVVAAAQLYGEKALKIATTVKLTRALWIIPITIIFSLRAHRTDFKKIKIPWFILGFLALSLIFTFSDGIQWIKPYFIFISKTGFALTLFLIGLTFDLKQIKKVGLKSLSFALSLWLIVSTATLLLINYF